MNPSPDIDWLSKRWQLPEEAIPAVAALLEAEASGSTACLLASVPSSWGVAASPPDKSSTTPHTPLVLIQDGSDTYLQSRALYRLEQGIAASLLRQASLSLTPPPNSGEAIARLFPADDENQRPRQACQTALQHSLALITGGPGSGKTYTLARILALMIGHVGVPAKDIQLAAPTGKAADRMSQAVRESVASMDQEAIREGHRNELQEVAERCSTLHSLLGYDWVSGGCRYNRENQLPHKVLIVDECSMVDVRLWMALLNAVPNDCRLILLGDPQQLESVGQGNILAALEACARKGLKPLSTCFVELTGSRRFGPDSGISRLANALRSSDEETAVQLLQESHLAATGEERDLTWLGPLDGALQREQLPQRIQHLIREVAQADTPEKALRSFRQFGVLTAQRRYSTGSLRIASDLQSELERTDETRNQPIIINRNDYETHLHNGEIGVIHLDSNGKPMAYFQKGQESEQLHSFSPSLLPDYSPAWAITIHRSQGSEYDHVVVVLPHLDSPLATRSLIYTAITRARKSVTLFGDLQAVRQAIATPSRRTSLLGLALSRVASRTTNPAGAE